MWLTYVWIELWRGGFHIHFKIRKGVMVLKCVIFFLSTGSVTVISFLMVSDGSTQPEQLPQAKKGEQLLHVL